jgi:hypothetical protein
MKKYLFLTSLKYNVNSIQFQTGMTHLDVFHIMKILIK